MDNDDYLGSISLFVGNYAPNNTKYCQGQLLEIGDFPALFSVLSDYYGGDGRSTFGLPDLRGRAPIKEGSGPGLTPRFIGQLYGSETNDVTLSEAQLPTHTHAAAFPASGLAQYANTALQSSTISAGTARCNVFAGGSTSPSSRYPGSAATPGLTVWSTTHNSTTMEPNPMQFPLIDALPVQTTLAAIPVLVSVASTGASAQIENVTQIPPFNAADYVIAVEGLYPPRS